MGFIATLSDIGSAGTAAVVCTEAAGITEAAGFSSMVGFSSGESEAVLKRSVEDIAQGE